MKLRKRLLFSALLGDLYALLLLILSRILFRSLGSLVRWIGIVSGLASGLTGQLSAAFGQLKSATLASPWLSAILACGVCAAAVGLIPRRNIRLSVRIALGIVFFLPGIALALLLTEVNGILFLRLLESILPLLPFLL